MGMKTLCLAAMAVCIAAAGPLHAERRARRPAKPESEKRSYAEKMTQHMVGKYELDDEQLLKVLKLFQEQSKLRSKAREKREPGERPTQPVSPDSLRRLFSQKLIPILDSQQLKVFFDETTKEMRAGAEARRADIREALGLKPEDAAWKKLEELLKKVDGIKAELACKLAVAHSKLRQFVDAAKKSDISKKLKEIDELKKETGEKIDELMAEVRKSISDDKWAKLVLDQLVD